MGGGGGFPGIQGARLLFLKRIISRDRTAVSIVSATEETIGTKIILHHLFSIERVLLL